MSSFEKLVLRFLYCTTIVHTYNALKLGGKCNKCNKIACVFIYERDVIKLYYPLWKISRNLVLFDLFHPPVSHPPLLADLYSRQLLLILIAYWVSIARKFHRPHCEHVSSTFNTLQILVNSSITITIIMHACFFFTFIVQTVEGNDLELQGITRSDMGPYLCIASNGIPSPVSKRIMLHVHCKWF